MEIGLIILGFLVGQFLPSYIREKGKTLATKEDVGAITKQVEDIKYQYSERLSTISHQNTMIVEQIRSGSQMHTAVLLKRMEILQKGYVLWIQLFHSLNNPDTVGTNIMACQKFWEENNLYLGSDIREKYKMAYLSAAASHHQYVQWRESPEIISNNMQYIREAGEALVAAAELPSIKNEFASVESFRS